jgi:hypothetical protein
MLLCFCRTLEHVHLLILDPSRSNSNGFLFTDGDLYTYMVWLSLVFSVVEDEEKQTRVWSTWNR